MEVKIRFAVPEIQRTTFSHGIIFLFFVTQRDFLVTGVRTADTALLRGKLPKGSHVSLKRDKMADRIEGEISQDEKGQMKKYTSTTRMYYR